MSESISKWPGRIALSATALAGLAICSAVLGGPGYRFAVLDVGTALSLTLLAVVLGFVALCAGCIAMFMMRNGKQQPHFLLAILASITGLFFCIVFFSAFQKARTLPPIHDISTDVSDPPRFLDVIPLRERASNPPQYDGKNAAKQQLQAYPAVKTVYSSASCEAVIASAKRVAADMGWEVISTTTDDAEECYMEAVATTTWFGFKDDVVIRARDNGFESTIDIRSKSRVGVSDLGANADRILKFSARLVKNLED